MLQKEGGDEDIDEEVPEMASLSSRFAFFEHHKQKQEEEEEKRKRSKRTPPKLRSHVFEDPLEEEEEAENGHREQRKGAEVDHARRECKARSVLNKFKEMEQRVLNGEEEEGTATCKSLFWPWFWWP